MQNLGLWMATTILSLTKELHKAIEGCRTVPPSGYLMGPSGIDGPQRGHGLMTEHWGSEGAGSNTPI